MASLALVAAACGPTAEGPEEVEVEESETPEPEEPEEHDEEVESPADPDQVTLRLSFRYGGRYSPFLVGVENGLYADEGLEVDVLEGQGSLTSAQAVGHGADDFGYVDAGAVAPAMDEGLPIQVVAQIRQVSALAIIATEESGITTFPDLEGHTLAVTAGDAGSQLLDGMADLHGFDVDEISIVNVEAAAKGQQFLAGNVDAITGLVDTQGLAFEAQGHSPSYLIYAEHGMPIVDHGIVASHEMIDENPDLVRRFVRASVLAWEWAIANPEESAEIGHRYFPESDLEQDIEAMRGLSRWLGDSWQEDHHIGWVPEEYWVQTLEVLAEHMGLSNTDPSHYFTNEFVPEKN